MVGWLEFREIPPTDPQPEKRVEADAHRGAAGHLDVFIGVRAQHDN